MLDSESDAHLETAREAAWRQIPAWGQLCALLTWKRQGYTPLWITTQVELEMRKQPGFDIAGGMAFYIIDSYLVSFAPPYVLRAIYGCLFAHTARFAFSSKRIIEQNGSSEVSLLPSWSETLLRARRWKFEVDRLQSWLDQN